MSEIIFCSNEFRNLNLQKKFRGKTEKAEEDLHKLAKMSRAKTVNVPKISATLSSLSNSEENESSILQILSPGFRVVTFQAWAAKFIE